MTSPTHYNHQRELLAWHGNLNHLCGEYGEVDNWLRSALRRYPILGQWVLLYGSCDQGFGPWYEAMLKQHGAYPSVTDYNKVSYETLDIPFTKSKDFINLQSEGIWADGIFDNIFSISSFEHSGLGRYGDEIDPDGDLKAMTEARSLLRDKGKMFLTVPLGLDKTVDNFHRIYGRESLPKLLAGWKIIEQFSDGPDLLLDRDTLNGWNPTNADGTFLHPGYPEYSPVLVLEKA